AAQAFKKTEHCFEMQFEMIERLSVGGGLDALLEPVFKLIPYKFGFASFCISNFCIHHAKKRFKLFECFLIFDTLLPTDQFIIKVADLSGFVAATHFAFFC